jgi:hypothetical protein
MGPDDHIDAVRQLTSASGHQSSQHPLRAVTHHRIAHSLGDNKTDPRRLTAACVGRVGMHGDVAATRMRSTFSTRPPKNGVKVGTASQSMTRRQHASSLRRKVRSDP